MFGTIGEREKTGGVSGLSSVLGIIFIIGFSPAGFPLYHKDLYTFGEIPNFCLAIVINLDARQSLSIVIDPTFCEFLSITMTNMFRRTFFFPLSEGRGWVVFSSLAVLLSFDSSESEAEGLVRW